MSNMKNVLILKRMVQDLRDMLETDQNADVQSKILMVRSMDGIRNIVEHMTGCYKLPLKWYAQSDETFIALINTPQEEK